MMDHFDSETHLRTASLELYVEELEHDLRVAQERIDDLELELAQLEMYAGQLEEEAFA